MGPGCGTEYGCPFLRFAHSASHIADGYALAPDAFLSCVCVLCGLCTCYACACVCALCVSCRLCGCFCRRRSPTPARSEMCCSRKPFPGARSIALQFHPDCPAALSHFPAVPSHCPAVPSHCHAVPLHNRAVPPDYPVVITLAVLPHCPTATIRWLFKCTVPNQHHPKCLSTSNTFFTLLVANALSNP